jgi:hypothetical protein
VGRKGFLNTVDHPTPADDLYYLKPLVNVQQTAAGAALFKGFYDPSGPGSYAYRLAPPRPHISQSVFLMAGTYALSWDDTIVTHGLQATQKFEVLLDGVQVLAQDFWIAQTGGGAQPSGHKSYSLDIASDRTACPSAVHVRLQLGHPGGLGAVRQSDHDRQPQPAGSRAGNRQR